MTSAAVDAETPAQVSIEPRGDGPRPRGPSQLLPRRPYPGLRPFEKAEWPIFCGRERLIQDVLTLLARNHFASVIGPSGSGKSSLVKAGVLATLERRHSRMGVRWRTGTMRPGASPLWSMAEGVLRALRPQLLGPDGELPASEVARLRVLIDTSDNGLAVVTQEFGLEENENFLLLVDQFEEIFRYKSEQEDQERSRLIELLLAGARDQPPGLYIITTMRSEYLGECARFSGLAETLNETHYLLPRMTEEELRQAIVEPARLKNGTIEDVLVERLITDIRSQEDQLPILQHTLLWMWIQEEEHREPESPAAAAIHLGLDDYEQLEPGRDAGQRGRVKNALSRHGDKILHGLSAEERKAAEVMFRRMVEVEEGLNKLRRPTRCGTIAKLAEVTLEVVQRVVDAFRAEDASFIYANRQRVAEDTAIDIMHESLIRQWGSLDGFVRRERACYEVYDELCRAAQRRREALGGLLDGLALSRGRHWLYEEQPTRLWARRYGGDFDAAISFLNESEEAEEQRQREQQELEEAARRQEEERRRLANELEQQALRARLKEQTKLAKERRRFTRLAAAASVIAVVLATAAGIGFWQARQAVVETKAGSFWYRLQLFGDPLRPEDVATLWDLGQQDEKVRVAFVRQLAGDRELLRRFGFKPQPIARAVGLRWPEEARQIAKQSVAHVASDQFDPTAADPFELFTYTRAVAAVAPLLDAAMAATATEKIANAINGLATQEELTDRQLWALAEMVGVFGERLGPAAIETARERLRRQITATPPAHGSDWHGRALSRVIEVMAPVLTDPERLQAARYLIPLLGQELDSWSAKAIPRALTALLPRLDSSRTPEMLNPLPPAIATSAVAKADRESSYLLTLVQVVETIASMRNDALVAAFARAVAARFAAPNEPLQSAALARAAVPLLERLDGNANGLLSAVAEVTLGDTAPEEAERVLRQAIRSSDGAPRTAAATAVLRILLNDWNRQGSLEETPNPYLRAAQARLLAMLAPDLTESSAATATTELLRMLPRTHDYVAREAIARAMAALAPRLSDPEREVALTAAKAALAKTGFSEEATAWARTVAELLPVGPAEFTAGIVEILKYPTAAGTPTEVLLGALADRRSDEAALRGRTRLDSALLDWLEDQLPNGPSLADPPLPPPSVPSEGAARAPG